MFVAGEMCYGLTTCFFRAARRWHKDLSIDARGCCWVGQRRYDACFGRGKKGVVVFARLLFGRHVAVVSGDCIGGVVVIGRFELSRELVCVLTFCLQDHSCAVSSGGAVSCWGLNGEGQVMLVVVFEGVVGLLRGRCMSGCK